MLRPGIAPQRAGIYAKQILSRLLIDLSWNSSRLEGNSYSLLDTRRLIEFGEQAFFVMAQLPYLQPFDDVNKRVSRLAANIPFIKANLSPLSFTDVLRPVYTDAMLGLYELNGIALLKDVFIWAYERSAARYAAVRQSLGEPDPFRLRHRDALRRIVREVVAGRMGRKAAAAHIASWARDNIARAERERFRDMAESELLGLHEGNYARYRLRPAEFAAWRDIWAGKAGTGEPGQQATEKM